MVRLAIIATLLFAASACEKKKEPDTAKLCSLVGCTSGVELQIGTFAVADLTPKDAATASVEVCLNKQCSSLPLRQLPSKAAAVHLDGVLGPDVSTSATVDVIPPDMTMISVEVTVDGEPKALKNGDVYHVTVKSADGRVLSDRSWSVPSYRITQPNGPGCEPTCAQPTKITEQASPGSAR